MNEKIDQVVTEDVEPSKIVVQCQSERRENPKAFLYVFWTSRSSRSHVRIWIWRPGFLGNIGPVIELERYLKSVGISCQGHSGNEDHCSEVTKREGSPSSPGFNGIPLFLNRVRAFSDANIFFAFHSISKST